MAYTFSDGITSNNIDLDKEIDYLNRESQARTTTSQQSLDHQAELEGQPPRANEGNAITYFNRAQQAARDTAQRLAAPQQQPMAQEQAAASPSSANAPSPASIGVSEATRFAEQNGGLSADPEYAQWRDKMRFDSQSLRTRKRRVAEHDFATADVAARVYQQLANGEGDVKQSKNGKFYRIVRFGAESDGPVKDANELYSRMGRKSRMRSIIGAIETDENGRPAQGARAMFRMGLLPTGGVDSKSEYNIVALDPGRVMNQWANNYATLYGNGDIAAARRVAYDRFGGTNSLLGDNPAGWDMAPTSRETFDENTRRNNADRELKAKDSERNYNLAMSKLDAQKQQFASELGYKRAQMVTDIYKQLAQNNGGVSAGDLFKALPDEEKANFFTGANGEMLTADQAREKGEALLSMAQGMSQVNIRPGDALGAANAFAAEVWPEAFPAAAQSAPAQQPAAPASGAPTYTDSKTGMTYEAVVDANGRIVGKRPVASTATQAPAPTVSAPMPAPTPAPAAPEASAQREQVGQNILSEITGKQERQARNEQARRERAGQQREAAKEQNLRNRAKDSAYAAELLRKREAEKRKNDNRKRKERNAKRDEEARAKGYKNADDMDKAELDAL